MTLFEQQQLTDSRVCRQWFGPRRAAWQRKGSREKVPEGRHGMTPLGGKREERREKREEGDKHDRDDRVEGRNGSDIEVRSAKCDLRDEQMAEQRDGEAQGRVDWKRDGWPDAKFEGTSAKCDL